MNGHPHALMMHSLSRVSKSLDNFIAKRNGESLFDCLTGSPGIEMDTAKCFIFFNLAAVGKE